MVLLSHFEYPICDCVHRYSISPCQTPFWNMSLAPRTKQWTTRILQKLCAHRDSVPTFVPEYKVSTLYSDRTPAPCPNSSVGTWKKGVFTLVPSQYQGWELHNSNETFHVQKKSNCGLIKNMHSSHVLARASRYLAASSFSLVPWFFSLKFHLSEQIPSPHATICNWSVI